MNKDLDDKKFHHLNFLNKIVDVKLSEYYVNLL